MLSDNCSLSRYVATAPRLWVFACVG